VPRAPAGDPPPGRRRSAADAGRNPAGGAPARRSAGGERAQAGAGHGSGGREPADAVFAALADRTRRAILRAVAEQGPVTATALSEGLPITRQAVAKHLGLLRDAGLVAADRAGRETRFVAVTGPLDDLAAWAEAAGRRWDDRLTRLRHQLGG
jgi:DNA-binding transcriptional ArsR family regulator